jgi:hypothetical protein
VSQAPSYFILHSAAAEDLALANAIRVALEDRGMEALPAPPFGQTVREWARSAGAQIKKAQAVILLWSASSSDCAYTQATISQYCVTPTRVLAITVGEVKDRVRMVEPEKVCVIRGVGDIAQCLKTLGIERETPVGGRGEITHLDYFLSEARKQFGFLSVLGEGEQRKIDDVFQPLRLCEVPDSSDASWALDDLIERAEMQYCFIVGAPGTGKTTSLKYLAYHCAQQRGEKLPIMIRLSQFAEGGKSLEDEVKRKLKATIFLAGMLEFERHPDFLGSKYVILLDGYDEVPEARRSELLRRLGEFVADHPKCRIIISSRPRELLNNDFPRELGQFRVLQLLPFSDEAIQAYLEGAMSPEAAQAAWAILLADERLLEIARVPFLLALIAKFGVDQTNLSRERSKLFDNCVKYVLGVKDWERAAGRPKISRDDARLMETVLKRIAVRFYKLDVDSEFSRSQILSVIEDEVIGAKDPEEVLERILTQTGLLQTVAEHITFVHRSIWEYFVASAMLSEPLENLLDRATSEKWEEPIRLYVGLQDEASLERTLTGVWGRNKGLALRAMSELEVLPRDILLALARDTSTRDRLAVIAEIRSLASQAADAHRRRRLLVDTLPPLLAVENNAQVAFEALSLIDEHKGVVSEADRDRIRNGVLDTDRMLERRQAFLLNGDYRLEFEPIPTGQFAMGGDHPERPQWMEGPIHDVQISTFFMSRYCVTNKLYYESGFPFAEDRRKRLSDGPNQPVVGVTWYEAAMFAMWLGCRLPTEAEWEYCCRSGGVDDERLADRSFLFDHAWYTANSANVSHDVGQKTPNTFNLYDMLGNVREWCSDWVSETYYEECLQVGLAVNPQGPSHGFAKILRGGCFDWNDLNLVPTYRNYKTPDEPYFTNGFRLALSVD